MFMSSTFAYRHGLDNHFYQNFKFYQLFVMNHTFHICKQTNPLHVTAIQYGRRNCSAEYHLCARSVSYDATQCQEIANKAATEQNTWTAHLPNIWHCVGTDYFTNTSQVHCIHNGFQNWNRLMAFRYFYSHSSPWHNDPQFNVRTKGDSSQWT
jgi:hypothetical protein